MPLTVVSGLATVTLAPLFVISSRVLVAPSDRDIRPLCVVTTGKGTGPTTARHEPRSQPCPAGTHWRAIARSVEDRIEGIRNAVELQSAAHVQIDAADFTLAGIVQDLVAIMPRASEFKTQPPRSLPVPRRALAA